MARQRPTPLSAPSSRAGTNSDAEQDANRQQLFEKKETLKVAVVISLGAVDCGAVIFNHFYPTDEGGGLPLILPTENTGYIQIVLRNIDVLMGKGSIDDCGMMLHTWGWMARVPRV